MKVILIHKSREDTADPLERRIPHGLYMIAALLKSRGIDCELLNLSNYDMNSAVNLVTSKNPDIAAFSVFSVNREVIFDIAMRLKQSNHKLKIIIGGPHAVPLHKNILEKYAFIDYVVLYEGEYAFLNLVNALDKNEDVSLLNNIAFRRNGKLITTGKAQRIDNLDKLPIPAKYFKYDSVMTSRGCPGRCIFCSTPKFWGQQIKFRSAENIVSELEMLKNKYGITKFHFWDDTFFINKKLVIDVCRKIIEKNMNIMWDCSSRVNLIDKEVLEWAKDAGCYAIYLGVESGSIDILRNIGKYTNPDQVRNACRLMQEAVMEYHFFILVGSPGETDETIEQTIELIKETKPHEISIAKLHIDPGTELYEICRNKRFIDDSFWFDCNLKPPLYTFEKEEDILNKWCDAIALAFNENKKYFLYKNEEIKQNIKYLEKKEYGNPSYNYFLLGSYKLMRKKLDEAAEMFLNSIRTNKGFAPSYNSLGITNGMKGNHEKALEYFNKASIMDPFNMKYHINLGLTCQKLGKYKEAVESINKAVEINPLRKKELCQKIKQSFEKVESIQRVSKQDSEKDDNKENSFSYSFYTENP